MCRDTISRARFAAPRDKQKALAGGYQTRTLDERKGTSMRATKIQTLTTIAAVIRKHNKKYCTASQNKMIELLANFYNVSIRRRMIGYHLADLRKMKLIKSIKRTHRKADGTLCLETSATCITPYGYQELWKLGCEWAKKMFDRLTKKYFPNKASQIKTPAPVNQEELDRRRALGGAMFKTEAYSKAFGLDR